jgi:hypothetical protein
MKVLHRDDQAIDQGRRRLPFRAPGIGGPSLVKRQLGGDGGEGPHEIVEVVHPPQVVIGQLDRGDLSCAHCARLLDSRQVMERHGQSLG